MKAKKSSGVPDGPWVPEGLEFIESDAWRSAGITVRRFVDFLKREHMKHGGKANGKLKAPWREVVMFVTARRHISKAIEQAEARGLIKVNRGTGRMPSTYTLTFLPRHDGWPATNEWRDYRDPNLQPLSTKSTGSNPVVVPQGVVAKGILLGSTKGEPQNPVVGTQRDTTKPVVVPLSVVAKGALPSRRSAFKGGDQDELGAEGKPETEGATCPAYVTNGVGYRICDQPVGAAGEYCPEHAEVASRIIRQ